MREISPHARPLRRRMTDAERTIWFAVRNRRLGGFKFKRQWTISRYVVDFCCLERGLVVEIDGGHHSDKTDAHRTRELNRLGYRVIRYWNNDVLQNREGVLTDLLSRLQTSPHPCPLPRAGEGEE